MVTIKDEKLETSSINTLLKEKSDVSDNDIKLMHLDYLDIIYKKVKDENGDEKICIYKEKIYYGDLVNKIINGEEIIPDVKPIIFKLFGDKTSEKPYIFIYDNGVYVKVSSRFIKDYIRKCLPVKIVTSKHIEEVLHQIMDRNDLFYDINKLDKDYDYYINFKNGILDIRTNEMIPHSPDILLTKKFDFDYKKVEDCKNTGYFDKYMNDLTTYDGDKIDEKAKHVLLQAMGLVLSNVPGHYTKKCILMKGAKDTGKTQLKKCLSSIIGKENTSGVELKAINDARFIGNEIYGKRLIGSNDLQYSTSDDMGKFKQLTGGDQISIEFKNQDPFSYTFTGFIWFLSNEFPPIGGTKGNEVYERFLLIPCDNVIKKENQDPELLNKLLSEQEYIVALCIEELKILMKNNFKFDESDRMLAENKKYETSNNSLLQFIEDCCIVGEDLLLKKNVERVKRSDFKTYYKRWCVSCNIRNPIAIKPSTFDYLFKTFGTECIKYNGNFRLSNIGMSEEGEEFWKVDTGKY